MFNNNDRMLLRDWISLKDLETKQQGLLSPRPPGENDAFFGYINSRDDSFSPSNATMERINLVNCAVLCIIVLYFGIVLAIPHYVSAQEEGGDKDNFWFGPRLGRKKRNQSNEETYKNSEAEQLVTLMDAVQDSPWAILAFSKGKRHTLSFTPRLGRDSGEEFTSQSSDQWPQAPEIYAELLSERSPPFAPRLGRRLSPYSPRLGKRNDRS